jgi:hypothetical protein
MHVDLIDPLVMNDTTMGRAGKKGTSPIGDKCIKLGTHGSSPSRVRCSLAIACGFYIMKNKMKTEQGIFGMKGFEARKLFRLKGPSVRVSGHMRNRLVSNWKDCRLMGNIRRGR